MTDPVSTTSNAADAHRHLQRQRHQRPPAGAAALAGADPTGRRLPAGAEGAAGALSASRDSATPGYGAIWHGQKSWNGVAILARGAVPIETRRGLPGDPDDTHSRYIEAAVGGLLIGCLYLPNGNPAPGPKFDYKLRWFERFIAHAAELLASGQAGGARRRLQRHARPSSTSTSRSAGSTTRCSGRRCATPFDRLVAQGWTDALRTLHPDERSTPSGTTSGTPSSATPACASTTCC